MILDTSDRSLQIVLGEAKVTSDCDIVACWAATSAVVFAPGMAQTVSNGTTAVTVATGPADGSVLQVSEVRLHNNDTVSHNVTLRLLDGATARVVLAKTIAAGADFLYAPTATSDVVTGGGGSYTLPAATASVLGGVKPDGTTIANTAGAISVSYGTSATTAAVGNDSRITGAQTAANVVTAIAAGNPGSFSTLAASGAVSGAGFTSLLASYAPQANPTFTGTVTAPLTNATTVHETRVAMAANNVDCSAGSFFTKTISGATTLTVSNVPASGIVASIVLELTNPSTNVTWWTGMKWPGGAAPTLSTTGVDVLGFYTADGGTTWRGMLLGKGMA